MKTISEYLEGVNVGDGVPSIRGVVTKDKPPKEEGKPRIVSITTPSSVHPETINLHFKAGAPIFSLLIKSGDSISITCAKDKPKAMVLKEGSKGNYISVTDGAVFSTVQDSTAFPAETPLEAEPITAADRAIDNYVLDRLYVFHRVLAVVTECGRDFPLEKIADLATSTHIELSRSNIKPRPTDKQLERKQVHKEKSVTEKPKESLKSSGDQDIIPFKVGWRDFKHPTSGVRLGDEKFPEKFTIVFYPWFVRQKRNLLDEKAQSLFDALKEAFEDLSFDSITSYSDYLVHYINEYLTSGKVDIDKVKIDVRINKMIDKFEKGLEDKEYVADREKISNSEADKILINFAKYWEEIIETEE